MLLDLWLGANVGSGLGLIPTILAAGARVVVLTASEDQVLLASCVEAGAFDLASKAEDFASILEKVEGALGDGPGLGPAVRQRYLAELAQARAADSERLAPFERLTPREREVLGELMDGRSAQEIALGHPGRAGDRAHPDPGDPAQARGVDPARGGGAGPAKRLASGGLSARSSTLTMETVRRPVDTLRPCSGRSGTLER